MPDCGLAWRPPTRVSFTLQLGVHRRGRSDPTYRAGPDGNVWRTARTPDGPGTVHLRLDDGLVHVRAWGPGARWLCAKVPDWLGAADDPPGFTDAHPLLAEVARRVQGPRVGRTGLVMEALVPAVLEQKVTGAESRRAWWWLVTRHGEPAPGPAPDGMRVVPAADRWARVPSWDWHRAGVGPQRSATIVRAARLAHRLEEVTHLDDTAADIRLRSVPGVGAWTSAEVRQRACGAVDAVSVGDTHLPRLIVFALTGRVSDSDQDMLAALEPYRGQRYRVQRLVELSGVRAPRFGPRYAPHDFREL